MFRHFGSWFWSRTCVGCFVHGVLRRMVRRGWTPIFFPAGWTQIIRCRRPPSVQWPIVHKEIPKRSHSPVSRIQAPKQQSLPKTTDPVKSKIMRIEAALTALGQEQSEARASLEEALKKARTQVPESRDTTSRPPEASLAEANAKIVRLEGSLAALGPDDIAERRVLEDALAKVRARAIIAPVGQRLDECKKCCERAAKRLEKAQEVVCEALNLRSHVAQLEGDLRQSHRLATEKISAETSLKQRIDLLMQEVASFEGPRASTSFWGHRVGVGASLQVRICVNVRFDRGGRQKTQMARRRCAVKWCKSAGARYGHRGVRVGEATNPGPPKRLQRSLASASQSNRFEILSSEDELEIPTTVPASSGAVRAVQEARESQAPRRVGRLVLVSQGVDPFPRMVPPAVEVMPGPTVGDTDTDIPHHVIGTLRDSDTDETMSIGQISGDGLVGVGEVDEFSVHSDEAVSVAGEGPESEVGSPFRKPAKQMLHTMSSACAGPTGMAAEHLCPLLDSTRDSDLLMELGCSFAQGRVPAEVIPLLRLGRITALQKPSGGIRGIVVGDVFRRLVARTRAQQLNAAVERATSPFQYALTTRAGVECVAHVVQTLTDLDPGATVLSVDGVGAFDLISRGAMLQGLRGVEGREAALPFVSLFCSSSSTYIWEDDAGITILSKEKGVNRVTP